VGSRTHQAGEAEKRKREQAGLKKLVVDLPPGVQRRREFVPLVFESSGYVAKLARRHITEWAGGARRVQGREGEESSASTRARRNLSSTVHYTYRYVYHFGSTQSHGRETVLREAMQALGRVQVDMLARMVVEIRSTD
jgi:hypothetical protein